MSQEQVNKETSKTEETEEVVEAKDVKNAELEQEVDGLLDEIDDVLEENAQEFVDNFVQKGGQ